MTLFTFALAEGGLHEKCQCIFWKKLKTFLRCKFKLTPGIYTDEATLGNYFTYSCAVLCCCWQQTAAIKCISWLFFVTNPVTCHLLFCRLFLYLDKCTTVYIPHCSIVD